MIIFSLAKDSTNFSRFSLTIIFSQQREESTNDDVQREVGSNEAEVKDAENIEEDEDLILKDYNSDTEERKDNESR